jgi:hypothetical protein
VDLDRLARRCRTVGIEILADGQLVRARNRWTHRSLSRSQIHWTLRSTSYPARYRSILRSYCLPRRLTSRYSIPSHFPLRPS